jgi:hypothetical protein
MPSISGNRQHGILFHNDFSIFLSKQTLFLMFQQAQEIVEPFSEDISTPWQDLFNPVPVLFNQIGSCLGTKTRYRNAPHNFFFERSGMFWRLCPTQLSSQDM